MPKVSVIIPSLKGGNNLPQLLKQIEGQTFKDIETIVIKGVSPNGKARNEGVKRARGKYLVFMDDDVSLGHERVIENLIPPLEGEDSIGMTGASVLLPENSNWLQRAFTNMRSGEFPVVKDIVDSDSAQHSCCALPKEVYTGVGWESDDLITGTDNDLRQRLHRSGYRVVVVPDTWVYHSTESTPFSIAKKLFVKGIGSAYALKVHPEIFGYPTVKLVNYQIKTVGGALLYKILSTFIKIPLCLFTLRVFQLFAEPVLTAGYVYGWFKFHGIRSRNKSPHEPVQPAAQAGIRDKATILIIWALYTIPDAILAFLKVLLFKNESCTAKRIRNILIYRTGSIGDLVCAIPSMIAVRRNFPGASITLLTTPGRKGLPTADEILGNPWYIDKIKTYYPSDFNGVGKVYRHIKELRHEHYDLFVGLTWNCEGFFTLVKKMLFAKALGVSGCIGVGLRIVKLFAATQSRLRPVKGEVESLLDLLRNDGISVNRVEFDLAVTQEDRQVVDHFLPTTREEGQPLTVAINPGAKRKSNQWPVERFARVGKMIKKEFGARIVITGAPDDRVKALYLKDEIGDDVIIAAGLLRVIQTAELLRRCDLLVSNDTGATHLAAAVGTPVVVIFCPRYVKGQWYPYGSENVVLRGHARCDNCFKMDCDRSECTESVSVEQVLQACEGILGKLKSVET